MDDIDKALADIGHIRGQLAVSKNFLGFTPHIIGATGLLAIALALVQVRESAHGTDALVLLWKWVLLAVFVSLLIVIDTIVRARLAHKMIANRMLLTVLKHFAPVGMIGGVFGVFVLMLAPNSAWLLPGLWQMLVAVGLYASLHCLPKAMIWAVAFYGLAGLGALFLNASGSVSPWSMGLPFGFGQMIVGAILYSDTAGGSHGSK